MKNKLNKNKKYKITEILPSEINNKIKLNCAFTKHKIFSDSSIEEIKLSLGIFISNPEEEIKFCIFGTLEGHDYIFTGSSNPEIRELEIEEKKKVIIEFAY